LSLGQEPDGLKYRELNVQPELPRPTPVLFARSLNVLDHFIHVRDPDPEDLGQDLLGRLELQTFSSSLETWRTIALFCGLTNSLKTPAIVIPSYV
jgi:hypothetical protein